MPLTGDVPHDIKAELKAGKPQDQAVAIAMNKHREVAGHDAVSRWSSKWTDQQVKDMHDGGKDKLPTGIAWADVEREYEKRIREMNRMDATDQWEEGYKAGLRGNNSTKYKDEAGKAREYHAGWLAAKKDKERKDTNSRKDDWTNKSVADLKKEYQALVREQSAMPADHQWKLGAEIRTIRCQIEVAEEAAKAVRKDADTVDTRKDATYKVTVKTRGMSEKEDTYTIQASSEFEAGIAARKKANKDWGGGGKGGADSWNVLKIVRADAADTKIEGKSVMQRLDDMTQQVNSVGQVAKKIVERMDVDEFKKGQRIHAGVGTKGGAGTYGIVEKVEDGYVHYTFEGGDDKFGKRTGKAPIRLVSRA